MTGPRAPGAEDTEVDVPQVLEAQEVTDVLYAAPDADTECELVRVEPPQVAPPLPLDALEPLAGPRASQPTHPGLCALGAGPDQPSSTRPELARVNPMVLRAPRRRPRTLAYGEMEARAIRGDVDAEEGILAPRVLYEIPLPPRSIRPPAGSRPDALEGTPSTSTSDHGLSPVVQRLAGRRPQTAPDVQPGSTSRGPTSRGPSPVDATRLLLPAARGRSLVAQEVVSGTSTHDLRSTAPVVGSGEGEGSEVEVPELEAPGPEATVGEPSTETTADVRRVLRDPDPLGGPQKWLAGRASLLALLLLGEAVVLPGYRDGEIIAPWTELTSPGTTSFTAATFFVLLLLMDRLPLTRVVRCVAMGVLATSLMLFGFLLVGSAVGLDAFDGQPALAALFRGPVSLRVVLITCACTLPTALLWHRADRTSPGARTLVAAGVLLVFFAYLALHRVGLGGALPVFVLIDAGLGSLFLGDRLASWLAFLPGLVAIASLSVLWPAWRPWDPGTLAGLFWIALALPLGLLAVYVAPMGQWLLILEPLQVVSTLAAGLLLLPVALSDLLLVASAADGGQGQGR